MGIKNLRAYKKREKGSHRQKRWEEEEPRPFSLKRAHGKAVELFRDQSWDGWFECEDDCLAFLDQKASSFSLKTTINILQSALHRFPNSDELREKLKDAEATQEKKRLKRIEKKASKQGKLVSHTYFTEKEVKTGKTPGHSNRTHIIQTKTVIRGSAEMVAIKRAEILLNLYKQTKDEPSSSGPTAEDVLNALEDAWDYNPGDIRILYHLASFYSEEGHFNEAMEALQTIYKLQNEENPLGSYTFGKRLLRKIGDVYLQDNCPMFALACYLEALRKDEAQGSVYHGKTLEKVLALQSRANPIPLIPFSHIRNMIENRHMDTHYYKSANLDDTDDPYEIYRQYELA